mmetsp:Transcript_39044/g.79935  ORF Transcript_39044/g.79935 Transcript_39044/m.79935 type:complete len:240 (-) Transcript_39044:62-781(-)|eukprot:CAMPEP_0181318538 /NCGR_PEP_ID=MMETSP1101-20121128/17059_1 /TAXON_ID=46948 /ORGANISM="Rhodomonas abbreviata, Strain Caron Lab Isolate" /LENGTH=239 /DNA_ID=CAMNT_0023426013 /DNA_START=153 /DNA_END=872 /DNA_ORIENTATION=-
MAMHQKCSKTPALSLSQPWIQGEGLKHPHFDTGSGDLAQNFGHISTNSPDVSPVTSPRHSACRLIDPENSDEASCNDTVSNSSLSASPVTSFLRESGVSYNSSVPASLGERCGNFQEVVSGQLPTCRPGGILRRKEWFHHAETPPGFVEQKRPMKTLRRVLSRGSAMFLGRTSTTGMICKKELEEEDRSRGPLTVRFNKVLVWEFVDDWFEDSELWRNCDPSREERWNYCTLLHQDDNC